MALRAQTYMASSIRGEAHIDVRDDMGDWMQLVASVNLPPSTVEAFNWGFNTNSVGPLHASTRSEQDLDDFMHGILFQVGGPLLSQTDTDGWGRNLPETNFRICSWGAAMTRPWEDCHQVARLPRMNPASVAGLGLAFMGDSASFG